MDDKKRKENKSHKVEQAEEFKSKYLRALADYQNLEKRISQDKERIRQNAYKEALLKLLPFLDELEKAQGFIKDPGLSIIRNKFYQTLSELGLEELQVLGKEFDPHVAEAVEVASGNKDNIMMEVLQKGYKFSGQLLRPARVKVSKRKF